MIGEKRSAYREKWRAYWRHAISLLGVSAQACAYCKGAAGGPSNALGLCESCYRAIPWIKEVHCTICGRYEICHDCKRRTDSAFVCSRSAVRYDERMKEWLARYKYRGDERLAVLLARMLLQGYYKLLQTERLRHGGFDCITFVPLNDERLAERGFNQAERLARIVGDNVGIEVVPLLDRVRHTSKQSFKTRAERLEDMRGVFQVRDTFRRGIEVPDRPLRILIIDDVYTTGSTLHQCALAITSQLDAVVYGLSWAR